MNRRALARLFCAISLVSWTAASGTEAKYPPGLKGKDLLARIIQIVGEHGFTNCTLTRPPPEAEENPNRSYDYACTRGISPQIYLTKDKSGWYVHGVSVAVNVDKGPLLPFVDALKIRDELILAFKTEYHLKCGAGETVTRDERYECKSEKPAFKFVIHAVSAEHLKETSLGGRFNATQDMRVSMSRDN